MPITPNSSSTALWGRFFGNCFAFATFCDVDSINDDNDVDDESLVMFGCFILSRRFRRTLFTILPTIGSPAEQIEEDPNAGVKNKNC